MAAASPRSLERAVDAYLTFLAVGARPRAGDDPRVPRRPRRLRATRGAPRATGRTVPTRRVRYLAARTRRGRRLDPGLAPTSLRRRAAAIKGFYRFAFGEGLIGIDVASHLDLPRMPRLLPETLTQAEVERLLAAPPEDALGERALLELLYAAGLRISEALNLDLEDLSLDGAFVRVIGKGDRERLVPGRRGRARRDPRVARRPARGARGGAPRRAGSRRARCCSAGAAAGWLASRRGPS